MSNFYLVVQTTEEAAVLQICEVDYEPRRFITPSGTYTVVSLEPSKSDEILNSIGELEYVWEEGQHVVTMLNHQEMLDLLAYYEPQEEV